MPRNCPWCGRILEIKALDFGTKIRHVCARCGFKIQEIIKPEPPKEESRSDVVEIKQEEVPTAKQTPVWPFILGAIVLIIIIIAIVKIFLV